jgi:dTDP-glucose 4,6-dehydratase
LKALGKSEALIKYVTDRPGHDKRYAIDSTKLKKELGFSPKIDFAHGMEETVRWYSENRDWWERIKSGVYLEYYKSMYENR